VTCRTGQFRLCDATDPWMGGIRYGSTPVAVPPSLWGGYSQYQYLHPNSVLHRVPDHVPAVKAALALPIVEWVCNEVGVAVGKTVVIQGPGEQGLGCVLAGKKHQAIPEFDSDRLITGGAGAPGAIHVTVLPWR
jgi:threonine dehydrogenase-like Zn-dependent dehydrogenase